MDKVQILELARQLHESSQSRPFTPDRFKHARELMEEAALVIVSLVRNHERFVSHAENRLGSLAHEIDAVIAERQR